MFTSLSSFPGIEFGLGRFRHGERVSNGRTACRRKYYTQIWEYASWQTSMSKVADPWHLNVFSIGQTDWELCEIQLLDKPWRFDDKPVKPHTGVKLPSFPGLVMYHARAAGCSESLRQNSARSKENRFTSSLNNDSLLKSLDHSESLVPSHTNSHRNLASSRSTENQEKQWNSMGTQPAVATSTLSITCLKKHPPTWKLQFRVRETHHSYEGRLTSSCPRRLLCQ